MATTVEPGTYRYELETSEPQQRCFGGVIEANPPATEEGLRAFVVSQHFQRGQSVMVTRFDLTRI